MNIFETQPALALFATAAFVASGCAGVQTAVDRSIAEGSMGQSYDADINSSEGTHKFGEQVHEAKLDGGAKLYLHVDGYESSSSTFLGIWGDSEYSYKVFAFKVKGGKVEDWAYALHQPEEEYTHVFGITFGYDEEPIVEDIKKKYQTMLETSSEGTVKDW
jgi:hypothetical protein